MNLRGSRQVCAPLKKMSQVSQRKEHKIIGCATAKKLSEYLNVKVSKYFVVKPFPLPNNTSIKR